MQSTLCKFSTSMSIEHTQAEKEMLGNIRRQESILTFRTRHLLDLLLTMECSVGYGITSPCRDLGDGPRLSFREKAMGKMLTFFWMLLQICSVK